MGLRLIARLSLTFCYHKFSLRHGQNPRLIDTHSLVSDDKVFFGYTKDSDTQVISPLLLYHFNCNINFRLVEEATAIRQVGP